MEPKDERAIATHIRRIYDEIAGQFARDHNEMEPAVLESAERFLALPRPPGLLLELGCGSGRDLAWFEGRGMRMVGADLSTGMLAEARARSQAALCQAEMSALCFRSGVFSGLWCNAALLHLPRAAASGALAEMRRVLPPGAPLFLSLQEGETEAWETRPNRPARLFTRYRQTEVGEMLDRAGFKTLEIRRAEVYDRAWLHALALCL